MYASEREHSLFYSILLWSVFCIALITRLFILSSVHHQYHLSGITFEHGTMALSLLRGEGFAYHADLYDRQYKENRLIDPIEFKHEIRSDDIYYTAHEVPGYAVLLASLWKIFGEERYIYVQLLQILFDSLCVFLIYWIARRLIGERIVALLAAFLFAIFIPEAYLASYALRDIWPVFFLLLITVFLIKSSDVQSRAARSLYYGGAGIVLGVSAMVHPVLQFSPPFFIAAMWVQRGWREALRFAVVSLSLLAVCLAPWVVRNYSHFHQVILTRDATWQGLWQSWGALPDNPMGAQYSDTATCDLMKTLSPGERCFTPAANAAFKPYVMEAFRDHIFWIVRAPLKRFENILSPAFSWQLPMKSENVGRMTVSKGFADTYDEYKRAKDWKSFVKIVYTYPGDVIWIALDKISHAILGFNPFLSASGRSDGGGLMALVVKVFLPLLSIPTSLSYLALALAGVFLRKEHWKRDCMLLVIPLYYYALLLPIASEPRYILPIFFVYIIFASYAMIHGPKRVREFILSGHARYTDQQKKV